MKSDGSDLGKRNVILGTCPALKEFSLTLCVLTPCQGGKFKISMEQNEKTKQTIQDLRLKNQAHNVSCFTP